LPNKSIRYMSRINYTFLQPNLFIPIGNILPA
jgi:hypothetical protein